VGDPRKAAQLLDPCDMPNEWPANLERHFEHHFGAVQRLDVPREAVARVRVPVLTIHGTWDRNAPYAAGREWAMTLPNARLLTVEGAAHQVTLDAPDIVIPAIDRFVGGAWPAGAERVTALERSASR
jgi:pimeloyl-ACP methyl ester carboxylesterase